MAKKKVKKAKKAVRVKKAKKVLKVKKVKAQAKPKEKVIGKIEHYFDNISVAAISVKAPFKVGDVIHVKGHTTDFVQRIESMQIEHQSIAKAKKGDDVGMKVKELCRDHDLVYLSNEKALTVQPAKPATVQAPLFSPPPAPEKKAGSSPYSNTKFVNF